MYRPNRRSRDAWHVPKRFCLKIGQTCLGPGPIPRICSIVHSLSLFPWDGELCPYFRCVCAIRSFLLVLHISGETEFTKFCSYSVFHFIDLLRTSTKFSLHTNFRNHKYDASTFN